MAAGSIDFEPGSIPPARPSAAVGVFRFHADGGSFAEKWEYLPNVRFLGCSYREGADPPTARFRYVFGDPLADPADPQRFEQCFPLDATGPRVVLNDDRLVVRVFRDDGYSEPLFDGFKSPCQVDLDGETESVTFLAVGTPIREFDEPVAGALYYPADFPPPGEDPVRTTLPVRFNPDGRPNATPKPDVAIPGNADDADETPVFMGPAWPANVINGAHLRAWTLDMAVIYLRTAYSPSAQDGGTVWTQLPQAAGLAGLFTAYQPSDPENSGPIDAGDGTTFVTAPINVIDYDAAGKAWPTAVEDLVAPHGFALCWRLRDGDAGDAPWGDPQWALWFYRRDDKANVKPLLLPPAGSDLDAASVNVGALALSRDVHELANKVYVDASPVRFEASFLLAPGFDVQGADASSLDNYIADNPDFDVYADDYRVYVFDECGEGHYSFQASDFVTDVPDLAPVLKTKLLAKPTFVIRRRPGINAILKRGPDGEALKAVLHVAPLNTLQGLGRAPGVWDGATGTWQLVDSSEWQLLDDRLGLRITCSNANSFSIGVPTATDAPYPSGKLAMVEQLAAPVAATDRFVFRLTCCIDGDVDLGMVAPKRSASPVKYAVARRVDARDRYRLWIQSQYSALKPASATKDVAIVDDTKEAKSYASSARRHLEFGSMAGSVTVPRISTSYQIGDKIDGIRGRGVDLRTNLGAETGESPVYPSVTGISWDCDGRQATTLELDDHVAMPPIPRKRKRR